MVIGITINNVIRDHITQLSKIYESLTGNKPIEPINPYDLEKSFPTVKTDFLESEFKPGDDSVLDPIESYDDFDVNKFLYEEASFEIFGRSDEMYDKILYKLKKMEKDLGVKIVLLNKETQRSKCATLFFLSKNGFDFSEIIFPKKDKDFWLNVDVLITDDPKILSKKPKNKYSIKVNNEFNVDIKSNFSIINIDEIKKIKKIIKTIKTK